jgi:hypothetical protein
VGHSASAGSSPSGAAGNSEYLISSAVLLVAGTIAAVAALILSWRVLTGPWIADDFARVGALMIFASFGVVISLASSVALASRLRAKSLAVWFLFALTILSVLLTRHAWSVF